MTIRPDQEGQDPSSLTQLSLPLPARYLVRADPGGPGPASGLPGVPAGLRQESDQGRGGLLWSWPLGQGGELQPALGGGAAPGGGGGIRDSLLLSLQPALLFLPELSH